MNAMPLCCADIEEHDVYYAAKITSWRHAPRLLLSPEAHE